VTREPQGSKVGQFRAAIVAEQRANPVGRRKHGASGSTEAEKLTLNQLNRLIAEATWRYQEGGLNSALRKSAFKYLTWLEAERERLHGIAAPDRRSPERISN